MPINRASLNGAGLCRLLAGLSAAGLLGLGAEPARASLEAAADAAADWLESPAAQNPDGSWGEMDDVKLLYTTAAVDALRAYGRRGTAYYRGVSWLENRAADGVDAHARRVVSLYPVGADLWMSRMYLVDSRSELAAPDSPGWRSWGLSAGYSASPLDTALALKAIALLTTLPPQEADLLSAAAAGQSYLREVQDASAGGWAPFSAAGAGTGAVNDPIVTALALRAYAAVYETGLVVDAIAFFESRNQALAFLQMQPTSLDPLSRAHIALALLTWDPADSAGLAQLATFDTSPPEERWLDDAYVTATVLEALATGLGTNAAGLEEAVAIPDPALRAALNITLGRNHLDLLTRADLLGLSALDLSGQGITDLTGLQEAANLTSVDLTGNIGILDPTLLYTLADLPGFVPPTPWCDVSQDHVVNAPDGLLAARAATGAVSLSATQAFVGDVAPPIGPGAGLTAADALLVMRGASTNAACGNGN